MDDQIEFDEPQNSVCDCCGCRTTHLVRFITRNEDAFAVYYADFGEGHDFVSLIAGFGDWDENCDPAQRTAFAFRIWVTENQFQVGLVDASDSLYSTSFLGTILDREEALKHPLKQEVFDLSDHIIACDQPVIEFLESRSLSS